MSRVNTPSGRKSKKWQAKYKRTSWAANNALSISRKILQKTVVNHDPYVESLKRNNADLARRVSELQKELSERAEELRESREEAFKLRRKLIRLQNVEEIVASSDVPEKLLLLADDAYRLHDILSRACSEIKYSHSLSVLSSENFATNANPANLDMNADKESRTPRNSLNSRDRRAVYHSVEMELDNSICSPKSGSSGRQALCVLLPDVEDVVMATPRRNSSRPGVEQIEGASIAKLSSEAGPASKPKRKKAAIVKKTSKPPKPAAATSNSGDQIELNESAIPFASHSEDVNKTDKKLSSSKPTVAAPLVLPKLKRRRVFLESEALEEPKNAKAQEDAADEEVKAGSITESAKSMTPSRRMSKKRRKRLRLIQDDSIFIPISDTMMESMNNSETLGTNKENVAVGIILKESLDRPSEHEEREDNKTEKKSELKSKKSNFRPKGHSADSENKTAKSVKNVKSNVRSRTLSAGALNRNPEIETLRAASSMDKRGSLLNSSIRPRRNTGSVSYVFELKKKVRQGDEFWCKE